MSIDSLKTLDAIRRLALKDLDATGGSTCWASAASEGDDPKAVARSVAIELDDIVASAMRERAAAAKNRVAAMPTTPKRRPALARIRELIENAFRIDTNLATAFREGTHQSDADLQSLYDDLVELGKIEPEGDD